MSVTTDPHCAPAAACWVDLARQVLDIEMEGIASVQQALGASFATAVEMLAACRGRVVVTGVGKSGLVGRKIAATLSSTGTPAFFLHPVEGAHGDLGMLRSDDAVLAISNSGETAELLAILPTMRTLAGPLIAMTGRPDSSLARKADVVLSTAVPREACPLGVAPTASTTATLALGDALAVCLIQAKSFDLNQFRTLHPGGALGQRLALQVADLMVREGLPTVSETAPLAEAIAQLDDRRLGLAAAVDAHGRLLGVLTDGDVRRLIRAGQLDPAAVALDSMRRNPVTVRPATPSWQALEIMERRAITVLPVVDEAGVLLGLVHIHDLLGKGQIGFQRL
jgi:arabinose-5-phosphate isomerase